MPEATRCRAGRSAWRALTCAGPLEEIGWLVAKRAVGLPGEVIHLDSLGRVHVGGDRLVESHARHAP